MKKQIYTITVTNWEKHNKNQKSSHKKIMLATNFLQDAKIEILPQGGKLLYLGILLACGDLAKSTIEASHEQLVRYAGGTGQRIERLLDQLKSLQLVRYEKTAPTIQYSTVQDRTVRDRTSRRGDATKPKQGELIPPDAPRSPKTATPVKTNLVIAAYCEAWKTRYKTSSSPPIRPQDSKNLRVQLVESVGEKRAIAMVEAYLSMPDQWFVTKRHDLATFLNSLPAVTHFLDTGKVVTRKDVQRIEEKANAQNLMAMIDEGKI